MRDGNIQMGGSGRPEQPRRAANDIAVMLQVASGRHQWPNNQLFAWPAITYQLAEWLSGLSIGPSRLSVLLGTRRCGGNKNERPLVSRSIWKPRHDKVPVTLAKKKSTPQEMLAPFWNILPQLKKVFKSRKTFKYSLNRLLYRSIKL